MDKATELRIAELDREVANNLAQLRHMRLIDEIRRATAKPKKKRKKKTERNRGTR